MLSLILSEKASNKHPKSLLFFVNLASIPSEISNIKEANIKIIIIIFHLNIRIVLVAEKLNSM